ncbi:MAG: pyrroline-5-carboxylate reductase [Pirellulales bacterium]|nr:pyrroline-5-carboxylate reductase [Pirellulales bacterium]
MKTLGFIGAGRMATALATGCIKAGLVPAPGVLASDPVAEARHKFAAAAPGARLVDSNGGVLADADTVILAVKPQMMSRVLGDIRQHAQPRHLFVSIAAGVTLARLAEGLPSGARLIRVMPNTPCLVGLGASCYSRGATATPDDAESVRRLLTSVGQAFEVEESQLDAVTGLSGSGPAFVYTVIEALAQGAIAQGLAADLALKLAAQTAAGAAAMVQQTGLTPAELRDQVASPGGTTLAGLEALGRRDAAGALQAAVEAATRRSRELGKT